MRRLRVVTIGISALVFCSLLHIYHVRNITVERQISLATSSSAPGKRDPIGAPSTASLVRFESATSASLSSTNTGIPDEPQTLDQAVYDYQRRVQTTHRNAQKCVAQRRSSLPQSIASINVTFALECLHRTTPNLPLQYPIDAEEHYNEIRWKMARWAQHSQHEYHKGAGYSGPWIENEFIAHFESLWEEQMGQNDTTCLPDYFGPFIPLFIPWTDHWIHAKSRYPDGFLEDLRSVLRPEVPYITVSQNDQGLRGYGHKFPMSSVPNILVLSAGGYGHVPIPLFKQEEPPNNHIPVRERSIDVSYVGSLTNAPYNARRLLHEQLMAWPNATASNDSVWKPFHSISYHYYYGDDWRKVMSHSRYSLVPRGYGRTAYHLMETLQMGLVPIYVYLDHDIPWVPYEDLFSKFGYVTTFDKAAALLETLQQTSWTELQRREERILSLRQSHFSVPGILNHIGRFMKGIENDLRCRALPPTTTGKL
jgi:hypothetical protein